MNKVIFGWLFLLLAFTGFGVWATYSDRLIEAAEQFQFDLREDSVSGKRPKFFESYFKKRGPLGGGFGHGK